MKSSPRPARAASPLSATLHNHLNAYALGATAAGVTLLAATQPARAEIVFTPVNGQIANGERLSLDLNHDGVVDFKLINDLHQSTTPFGDDLSIKPVVAGNAVWGGRSNRVFYFAAALPPGIAINSQAPFQARQLNLAFASLTAITYVSGGPWKSARNRFLGLKFLINGEVHFGWARLTVTADKHKEEVTAVLTGYAYETVANTPINAGQTSGPAQSASLTEPTPSSGPSLLGFLALGSSGLSAWRRDEPLDQVQ